MNFTLRTNCFCCIPKILHGCVFIAMKADRPHPASMYTHPQYPQLLRLDMSQPQDTCSSLGCPQALSLQSWQRWHKSTDRTAMWRGLRFQPCFLNDKPLGIIWLQPCHGMWAPRPPPPQHSCTPWAFRDSAAPAATASERLFGGPHPFLPILFNNDTSRLWMNWTTLYSWLPPFQTPATSGCHAANHSPLPGSVLWNLIFSTLALCAPADGVSGWGVQDGGMGHLRWSLYVLPAANWLLHSPLAPLKLTFSPSCSPSSLSQEMFPHFLFHSSV